MKIGNVTLNITPTSENYQMTDKLYGTMERALDHRLVCRNVTTKKIWRMEFYALDQSGNLALEAKSGNDLTFVDYDDSEYTVRITELGPVIGYPRSDIGRMYVILEEV